MSMFNGLRLAGRSVKFAARQLAAAGLSASVLLGAFAEASAAPRSVPPGNRNAEQPAIPFASARRTAAMRSTYDAKFERVLGVLRRDTALISDIKRVAARYDIDPVHMIGAIVGEHTYNYDSLDSAQSYYVKALSYAGVSLNFAHGGVNVTDFVQKPQFSACNTGATQNDSNKLWTCYERVWDSDFRGKSVDGTRYPRTNFNETFFQPLFSGQSFGLGQLSPLTVLKMTDRVARQSRMQRLTADNARDVYQATMDPNISLHYMAAIIQDAIEAYRIVGDVDISNNPGITATLYNLGDSWTRAAQFRRSGNTWPQENYYGWLVNEKLEKLRSLL
ncbi:DUF1402 family protein [Pannonibacter phragmitetus]|uniref:DUF1402 family protein n=1 Tax=Pannonibacter phragmitetus TaxID=121719 RepID=UPI000ACD34BF|nr:DUF1402 family protein [Pannonibacter phragmitetus]